KEKNRLAEQINNLNKHLQDKQDVINGLLKDYQALNQTLTATQGQLNQTHTDLDNLTHDKQRSDRVNSRLINQGLEDLNAAHREQADLINQLKELKRNNTRLTGANKQQAEAYTNQVQELADKLVFTNSTLNEQINKLNSTLQDATDSLNRTKTELET
ncbi:hypothetical protein C1645_842695, partial [Glomus cerebriforme]